MYWKITQIDSKTVRGWAYDGGRPELDLEIFALQGDNIVGRARADEPLPEDATAPAKKNCAFTLPLAGVNTLTNLKVVCLSPLQKGQALILYSQDQAEIGTHILPYQSMGAQGGSDSAQKFAKLGLSSFRNKKVLDLGCNEGFFSLKAHWGGASRVLGLDSSAWFIEKARRNVSGYEDLAAKGLLEFHQASWWELPDEKFDVIFFLSAIHYEKEQQKLLDMLAARLSPKGVLVLECGVVADDESGGADWLEVQRANDTALFPARSHLLNSLLEKYAVREIGPSVPQKGDPVPRRVFHCSPRKPAVAVIRGAAKSGKSVLAGVLKNKGLSVVKSDWFFAGGHWPEPVPQTPLYDFLRGGLNYERMHTVAGKLKELDAVDEFCRDFIAALPLDEDLTIVEGEVFAHDFVFERLVFFLKKNGAIVWEIARK